VSDQALAERIHNRTLQLLGSAMLQTEMAEQLLELGRTSEVPPALEQLRGSLEEAVVELRSIMRELRESAA
jgi:hypothetical protein